MEGLKEVEGKIGGPATEEGTEVILRLLFWGMPEPRLVRGETLEVAGVAKAAVQMSVERLNPEMAIGFVVNKSVHNDTDGSGYYGYYYSERSE